MLNFNGHENTDFAGHHHNNSIFGQQSQSSPCQIFSSFPAAPNGSYAQRSVHNGAAVSGVAGGGGGGVSIVNNKNEFGAVIHNPVTGNGTYNGSENVKRFSVNNLLKLANCGGGIERVNGT